MEQVTQEAAGARDACPVFMSGEWLDGQDPVDCARCHAPIQPGELFIPAGRCVFGGLVTGPGMMAYRDMLELEGEHLRCAAAARGNPQALCYTVGHGTRTLEELVELLGEHRIRLVADIRTVPKSRHNPQFAGEALSETLPESGICYLHLPALGGLRKPRRDSPNSGWRNTSFRGYADYMGTPEFEAALADLMALLSLQPTAIMCAETVYWRCHRSLVADALLVRSIGSLHLLTPGKATPHTLTRHARQDGTRITYPPPADADSGNADC